MMNRKQRRQSDKLNRNILELEQLYQVAQQTQKSGDYAKAEQLLMDLIVRFEKSLGASNPATVGSLYNLAEVLFAEGRYSEAENYFQRSLALWEQSLGSNHPTTAANINALAVVYNETGRFAEAEKYYKRSLVIMEQELGQDHPDTAAILNNIAVVYKRIARYAEAEEVFQKSLAIMENGPDGDPLVTAACLDGLAGIYETTGRFTDSEAFYQQALLITEQALSTDHPNTARCIHNLAAAYEATGCYAEAECYYQRSLTIWEKALGSDHPYTAGCLNNLAGIYKATGRYAEAEHYYLNSLATWEKSLGHSHIVTAGGHNNLAVLYQVTGRYVEAENSHQRALAMTMRALGLSHPAVASSLKNLAIVFKATGRLNAAILLYKHSVNILQKIRQNVSTIGLEVLSTFDKTIESYYNNLAHALIKAGRFGEAEYVMGMFKEKEQFELLRRDRLIDLPTRTISYNDAEAPLMERFDEISSNLFTLGKQEQALRQSKELAPEKNLGLDTVKGRLKKVTQEFSNFLDNLHEALPPQEVTQIDQDSYNLINMTDADAYTVAIFTVTAEYSFHSVMVTPLGRKAFSADHKATDIATKVLKFRELLKDPEDQTYLALSQELYNIIIRPMENVLLSGEYTTILWMLSGVLRLLPFAALHDGKQFVLEKFRNVCITTCSTIGQQPHESWNGLGMGVTLKHGDHSPLPAVKEELEGIISMDCATGVMPGDILLDEAFTRDAMESHLKEGYKAVHIASHFELNPANETMSYLLLGDGTKIRMDELRSNPRLFKGVDLVAFSACSTGLGTASTRGREVDGIGYLGEMQGAKTVMATLWPVEDKSTSILMREFYRLREEGMTTAEALRQAQLCLLNGTFKSEEGHDFTHPYFWAPFILIGNGG